MKKGYIQIYTGDGKGKTTAALGQGIRAVGNGFTVIMIQFLKGIQSGEMNTIKRLKPDFQIIRFEASNKFFNDMTEEERILVRSEIQKGINYALDLMKNQSCDLLIMDEFMGALHGGFLSLEQAVNFMRSKPDSLELILTGRNVPQPIAELADLITEMKPVKHYFDQGVSARKGIEF